MTKYIAEITYINGVDSVEEFDAPEGYTTYDYINDRDINNIIGDRVSDNVNNTYDVAVYPEAEWDDSDPEDIYDKYGVCTIKREEK